MRFISRYRLEPGGLKRLEVARNFTWTEVIVRLDGRELVRTDSDALSSGVDVSLPDGGVLRIVLQLGPRGVPFLYLTRNGRPVAGSEGDPWKIIREVAILLGLVAGVQLLFVALLVATGKFEPADWGFVVSAAVLIMLAVLTWKRSVVSIVIGSVTAFTEIVAVLVVEARWDVTTIWPMGFLIIVLAWFFRRGVLAALWLRATTLPVRHPPRRAGALDRPRPS